ncbi:MAG: DUF4435 domain-containing protein, partial [Clostridiales bacterium]
GFNLLCFNGKYKRIINDEIVKISDHYNNFKFTVDIFRKLEYFSNNIIFIGANGSGKSSLALKLKQNMGGQGLHISAQKVLKIKEFDNIVSKKRAISKLNNHISSYRNYKDDDSFREITEEFELVIQALISEYISGLNDYKNINKEKEKAGEIPHYPVMTKLDRVFEIWNNLIKHREIYIKDGINIYVKYKDYEYEVNKMSDGEKVILYYIAFVLYAKENSFIIVDEPEMFLQQSIVDNLWNILETERMDCIFIYLTHNVDFAVRRNTFKKFWVKSFSQPDKWDLHSLPKNEIPEELLIELIGVRKKILFCEGKNGKSIDEKIYNAIFPNFKIVLVNNCKSVIDYTRAYNKIHEKYEEAIGIIDRDFLDDDKANKLKKDNIFTFDVAEIENLLLLEDVLKLYSSRDDINDFSLVGNVKEDIIKKFEQNKDEQITKYVKSKLHNNFKDIIIKSKDGICGLEAEYENIMNKINLRKWYDEREKEINDIIMDKDYERCLKLYNNKGLSGVANHYFKVKDYNNRILILLNNKKFSKREELLNIVKRVYPNKLLELHNEQFNNFI